MKFTMIICRYNGDIPSFQNLHVIKSMGNFEDVYSIYRKVIQENEFFVISYIKCRKALKICSDNIVLITTSGCGINGMLKIHNFRLNYLIKKYKKYKKYKRRFLIHCILSKWGLIMELRHMIIKYGY